MDSIFMKPKGHIPQKLIFHSRHSRGQNNEQSEYLLRLQLFIPPFPVQLRKRGINMN